MNDMRLQKGWYLVLKTNYFAENTGTVKVFIGTVDLIATYSLHVIETCRVINNECIAEGNLPSSRNRAISCYATLSSPKKRQ